MDKYEVPNSYPGLRNYVVPVRGTDATCYIGVFDTKPHRWCYSLWTGAGTERDTRLISTDTLDMSGADPTPEQVARIAYLCDVDYAR